MKGFNNKAGLIIFFSFLMININFGQKPITRISEAEVNIQKVYIEANKEKLLGNHEDAIVLFGEVLRKQPNNDAAAFELARLYQKTGDKLKAKANGKKSVTLQPDNIWYSQYYAEILSEDGENEQAAEIYKNLSTRYPNNEDFYFEWAYMLVRANKPNEAIKIYDKLEDKFGVDERLTKRKYALYNVQNKTKKAESELVKLVKAYPREVRYKQKLADHYEGQNKTNKAQKIYKEILVMDPNHPEANLALAETFKKNGQEEQYLTAIKPLFKNPSTSIDLKVKELVPYIRKMPSYKNKDNIRNLLFDLGETLTLVHPKDAKAYSVYGDLLYHANETERALNVYKSTLKHDKSVYVVWEQTMYILSELHRADELLKMTEEALDLFPNQATIYFLNGVGHAMKSNHKESISSMEQALMMSRRDKSLRYRIYTELGAQYHYSKKYTKSIKAFESAMAINARDAYTLNNYAYFLSEQGKDLEKAQQLSSSANQLKPNQPSYQDTYGWILFKKAEYVKAERWIKKALVSSGENNADILEHYGDVLYKLDKTEEAVTYWQKAKEKGSKSSRLSKKITDRKLP